MPSTALIHETFGAAQGGPVLEEEYWVSLPDGPERIDAATARRLLEGAEVLDLRSGTGPEGLGAVQPAGGAPVDERQKHPHVGETASQVVVPQGAILGVPEAGPAPESPADQPREAAAAA